jgi:hypothetical protein
MNRCEYIAANPISNKEELIELNVEYLLWVFAGIEDTFSVPKDQIVGMPARDYVPSVIDKVCGDPPPKGIFYLVKVDGKLAPPPIEGCGRDQAHLLPP